MRKLFILFVAKLTVIFNLYSNQQETDTIRPSVDLEEVVIIATKTERNKLDIPSRIDVIGPEIISNSSVTQIDDILRFAAGVNVNRSTGIYSQRPMVTLRGLSGDEQSRTLVLMNGVPINTSDEGGVNWNRINHNDIERIEIMKGPGSSLYGNNAMGGVINIITKTPQQPQEVFSSVSYGTYNTLRQDLNVRILSEDGYYGVLSQYYLESDGYINIPEEDIGPYDIERFLEAIGVSARVGYNESDWFNWELQYDVFRDQRGEGMKIHSPHGNYRNFNTDLFRGTIKGGNDNTNYNISGFYQMENYYDINERMRNDNYSRFDVNSYREDIGFFGNISHDLIENNTITGGIEYKKGSIDGGDYYQTAPFDTIVNAGNLTTFAGYLQDEHGFLDNRINLITGIRFDHVTFSDGVFQSTDPWEETPELEDNTWTTFSPRAGARFNFIENFSSYISYSQGFRASILDDLTRTGWMWVGPKYANPNLEPEYIDNYEVGVDYFPLSNLKFSASVYLMHGKDFLYYVATEDEIFGRPIFRRENVTDVEAKGFEAETHYSITNNIQILGSYTFAESKIVGFDERPELEGKHLKYVPTHSGSISLFWQSPFVNFSLRGVYKGEQFADDANDVILDDYITFDFSASRSIRDNFIISVDVQNILDNKHMQTIDYLSPGRLISGRIALKI